MKIIDYSEVIERIKKIKNFKNDVMLAEYLQVTRQAIHGFKKNKVPLEVLIEICENENVSLDWLLLGREPEKPAAPESDLERRIAELEKIIKKG